jgi:hypothetical protein
MLAGGETNCSNRIRHWQVAVILNQQSRRPLFAPQRGTRNLGKTDPLVTVDKIEAHII